MNLIEALRDLYWTYFGRFVEEHFPDETEWLPIDYVV